MKSLKKENRGLLRTRKCLAAVALAHPDRIRSQRYVVEIRSKQDIAQTITPPCLPRLHCGCPWTSGILIYSHPSSACRNRGRGDPQSLNVGNRNFSIKNVIRTLILANGTYDSMVIWSRRCKKEQCVRKVNQFRNNWDVSATRTRTACFKLLKI